MSYHRALNASHGHVSVTIPPEVTSKTSGPLLEHRIPSALADVREKREEEEEEEEEAGEEEKKKEEEVWKRYHYLMEVGAAPTDAPCSSPINGPLPPVPLPHRRPGYRRHKTAAAASVLRHLDPRVNFYVTHANASEYVTAGKTYTRSATPVWNRALLGRGRLALGPGRDHSGNSSSDGQAARTELSPGSGGTSGSERGVFLNVDVTKIRQQQQQQQQQGVEDVTLSPFAFRLLKDPVPTHANLIVLHQQQQQQQQSSPRASFSIPVSQHLECGGRQQGGSCRNYGSATRRLALTAERSPEDQTEQREEHVQPVHPFLRMYQTRPGAFARLLSRDADVRAGAARVMPGSTIASLMVPHPAAVGAGAGAGVGVGVGVGEEGREEEDEEEFEECVQGTTIDMKKKKKRKKYRPRFTLPALRFNVMDWPRRQHRRPGQRSRNDRDNDSNGDETQEGGKDARGCGKTPIPKTHLHTLSEFPKQFVLSSRREDGIPEDLHRSFSDSDAVDWLQDVTRDPEELQRLDREVQSFTDMDYVLPSHLDQLLRQEGVDERVVDTTVALGKVWHDRAAYLNRIYHVKRRKYLARPSRYSSLPPIPKAPPQPLPTSASDVDARREKRESRSRPWEKPRDTFPELSKSALRSEAKAQAGKAETPESKAHADLERFRLEVEQFRTEVEQIRWEAEKQQEVASLPPDFIQPRIVLISSKVPRCQSISKAIRRGDNSILYIVYDFDTCSFDELLDTARQRLEEYSPGCKAKSVLLMCQGAAGCLYLFRRIVITPQKMRRVQYQQVKEFWKSLGELMSKVDHEDTCLHLLGGQLDNAQGKNLLYEIQKAILPNLVTVTWVNESADDGREAIENYFDFRKLMLWRAKHDSGNSLDYTDITRSWSSLADEADEMDTR